MNKIGIYFAYWTQEWTADFHLYIDKVADLGFDILEVNAGAIVSLSREARMALKAHADDRGITLSYNIGLPKQYDVSSPDTAVRANGIAYVQQMARAIGEMGGGSIAGVLHGTWPAALPPSETDNRPYFERSVVSMREMIKTAEDQNVFISAEALNRFEHFWINTCDEAIAYVDAVGSPNLKVLLDTYHMNIEEDFIGAAIEKAGAKLGHFHVGENNRRPPGYGHMPWTEIGAALRKINYQGYVVMEPFVTPGGQVGSDVKVNRDLSGGADRDSDAHNALLFMRGLLK